MRTAARTLSVLLVSVVALACRGKPEEKPIPIASTPASASAAAAVASAEPKSRHSAHTERPAPLAAAPFEVTTSDGVVLVGSFVRSPDPGVPVVVLSHHWAGSHDDWKPLVDRLSRVAQAPHLLAIDLRGHGGSNRRASDAAKHATSPIAWHLMSDKDAAVAAKDLPAVLAEVDRKLGTRAPAFVLVGDDFGATASVLAAAAEPRVMALALVSPGAALHGIDVYRPFARVRDRAIFVAASAADPVSVDAVAALAGMAKQATIRRYPGEAHTVVQIATAHPEVWDDLEDFLLGPALAAKAPAPAASAAVEPASSGANAKPPRK